MAGHSWYEGKTSNHQGQVIEEVTGRTVAVAYDKADAQLIAAAPDLLAALEAAEGRLERDDDSGGAIEVRRLVSAAIAKAKGGA